LRGLNKRSVAARLALHCVALLFSRRADSLSPVAVIEGGDEHANGVVQIKDLALGKALAANITSNEEWKAHPAQLEISRNELVAEVRKMIARAE